ncbi:hypothetical protein [Lactiplantibacillus plantarum]|uniref:hypothetical protein n=1 Tax=Lactiplantibacillus plantarum TaxID=1590 RepID=UPI000704B42A|nr:hypothetical protein [Lactiplantibacillus plantarum]
MPLLLSAPTVPTDFYKMISGATVTPDSIVNNLKGRGFMKDMDKAAVLSKRNQDVLVGFNKASSLATCLGRM